MLQMVASAAMVLIAQAMDPAVAPRSAPTTGPAPSAAGTPAGDKIVCKYETVTGSNLSARTCHTASEWDKIAADSRASVEHMQQNNGFVHGH